MSIIIAPCESVDFGEMTFEIASAFYFQLVQRLEGEVGDCGNKVCVGRTGIEGTGQQKRLVFASSLPDPRGEHHQLNSEWIWVAWTALEYG